MRITCLPIDSQQLVEPSGLVGKGDLERVPEMMHKGEYLCTPQIGENQQPAACRLDVGCTLSGQVPAQSWLDGTTRRTQSKHGKFPFVRRQGECKSTATLTISWRHLYARRRDDRHRTQKVGVLLS